MTFRRLAVALAPVALAVTTLAGCSSSGGDTSASAPAPIATATRTVTSAAPPTGSGAPASTPAGGSGTGSGGGGSTSSGSSGSSGGSSPGLCTPTVMSYQLGQSSGAAGRRYVPVIATNGSQSPCVTTGFPGVALLNAAGGQYAQATRDQSEPVTTIVVQPGEKIVANVGFSDVPQGGTGQCPNAAGFLFTLPDNTDSDKLAYDGAACGVTVQAFTRYQG